MAKLTLAFLMAFLAIVQGCPNAATDKDPGIAVSYDGTMQSILLGAPASERNGSQQQPLNYYISDSVLDCIRVRIVRDRTHVEVSVKSCNGSSEAFQYERELREALGVLQTSRLWISSKEDGLVKFSECWTGGALAFYVAVEKQCLASKEAGPCRDIASGRKTLGTLFGQMKSFDARDMLPKGENAGAERGGQAVLVVLGLLLGVITVIVFK